MNEIDATNSSLVMAHVLPHSEEYPFCFEPSCSCHQDQEMLNQVASFVHEGLMTSREATAFVIGHVI